MEYVNGGKTLQLNQMINFFSYHTSFSFSWLEMLFPFLISPFCTAFV